MSDDAIDDRILLPQNVTKMMISNPMLLQYASHRDVNPVFVDNNPYKKRWPMKRADVVECYDLLQSSLLIDQWMHDSWLYDPQFINSRPSAYVKSINTALAYIKDLLELHVDTDVFLLSGTMSR